MSIGSEYGNYDDPRDDWIRSLLTRILYLLVLAAAFILLICWFLPLVKERERQQNALQNLKQQVEQERTSYNRQSKKLTLLQNDPAYTELLARDKLDLMKPGETIFRMEPGPENSH
ncbi:MAG: septum formation initiator family protein [Verrucomicrobia bacterium]|nr:septum formation initiator family protein [Verrucomicrobiota bacterium]MBV8378655.1 septum formation initiator family protein [Verrucomicrobiota bacterium]